MVNYFRSISRRMCMIMRQNFAQSCEDKLNEQINMELKACHQYLAMVRSPQKEREQVNSEKEI